MAHLLLIRGLPGSGKSTIARKYAERGYRHYEADMFFITSDGQYVFEPKKIKQAHIWCQQMTHRALAHGKNVVVANTFTTRWEVQPYRDIAANVGCGIEIITATGNYKNIHGVPDHAIERMRARWEELT